LRACFPGLLPEIVASVYTNCTNKIYIVDLK